MRVYHSGLSVEEGDDVPEGPGVKNKTYLNQQLRWNSVFHLAALLGSSFIFLIQIHPETFAKTFN